MSRPLSKWCLHLVRITLTLSLLVRDGLAQSEYDCPSTSKTTLQAERVVRYLSFPPDGSGYNYPSNCDHEWEIINSGGLLELTLLELNIERSSDCGFDSLIISYGNADAIGWHQIAKLCGTLGSQNRTIDGIERNTNIILRFIADGSITGKGFKIAYVIKPGNEDEEEEQVINLIATDHDQYLDYPETGIYSYPNDADVRWRITASNSRGKLRISVLRMDIEDQAKCNYDSLTIYDGYNSDAPELKKLCGTNLMPSNGELTFRSSSQQLFLHFKSDVNQGRAGFRILYTDDNSGSECQNGPNDVNSLSATDVENYLTSPNYPDNYPSDCRMQWRIVSNGQRVKFNILALDLNDHSGCHLGSLVFYDGYDDSGSVFKTLCGSQSKYSSTFYSSSSTVYVRFFSDTNWDHSGFRISFQTEDLECQNDPNDAILLSATDAENYLTSPNYPRNYPSDCRIQWRIVSSQERVRFNILALDMEDNSGCGYDSLVFYDGYDDSARIVQTLCGSQYKYSSTFYSSSNYVYIRFISDTYSHGSGFRISFQAEDESYSPDAESSSSGSRAALVGGIMAGICILLIIIGMVGYMVKRTQQQQRIQQQRNNRSLANSGVTHTTSGSQSPSVYVLSPSAPPPSYASLNHGFVPEAPPPSYSEANLYTVTPTAPPSYSNAMLSNTTDQTTPATLPGLYVMAAAFKEEDNQHIYANELAPGADSQNQETSLSQVQVSGQEPLPDDEHRLNDEHPSSDLGQEQHQDP